MSSEGKALTNEVDENESLLPDDPNNEDNGGRTPGRNDVSDENGAVSTNEASLPNLPPSMPDVDSQTAALAPWLLPHGTSYGQMASHPNATAAQATSASFLNDFLLNQMSSSNQLMPNALHPQVPQPLPASMQVQPHLLPASVQSLLGQLLAQQNQNTSTAPGLQQAPQAPIMNQTTTSSVTHQNQIQLIQNLIQEKLASGQTNAMNNQQNMATLYNFQHPATTSSSQNMHLQNMANFPSSAGYTNNQQATAPVLALAAAYNPGISSNIAAAAPALNSGTLSTLPNPNQPYPSQNVGGNGNDRGAMANEVLKRLTAGKSAVQGSKEQRWMIRYEELLEFHQKHGHCRVPHSYCENRKLSWWVMNQRAQYKLFRQGKKSWLTDERVMLLDAIGFEWTPIIGKSGRK